MLDIKTIKQDKGSVECGLATLSMLYSYYEEDKTLDDLRKELPTVQFGTFSPQLGINLLHDGFEVEIITRNPLLVERKDKDLSSETLLSKLEEKLAQYKTKDDNYTGVDYFIKFMKAGGKVKVKIPDIEDLREELNSNRPVIAFLSNSSLYKENIAKKLNQPFNYTFHIVLVVGA
ncbi:MAG TPA: C39 family peptidase, partial [Candidatus Eisenbacteria bacterium]|nr:C39 family peptidase [Candidatus Eisenbacteria bacterium]